MLPYLDIPFQHASPDVLKRMKRPAAQEKTLERIARWREICPDLTFRSTFIVGFPGETEQDFEMLLDWLDEAALDRVGCFKYEPVRGAAANDLGAPVPDEVKEERWHRFMQRAAGDLGAAPQAQGRHAPAGHHRRGRADASPRAARKADAPEIDGAVYVASRRPLRVGEIATVKIERADEYDLHGSAVGSESGTPSSLFRRNHVPQRNVTQTFQNLMEVCAMQLRKTVLLAALMAAASRRRLRPQSSLRQ